MSDPTITLEVMRYRPGRENAPVYQSYQVPYREDWVVLDALNYIKDEIDGTLSYRWSCRMGVCGSCGMMINGTPKLSCAAFLKDYYPAGREPAGSQGTRETAAEPRDSRAGRDRAAVRVEPLANFPIARDLVIVIDEFMEKLSRVKPWIIREDERPASEGEYRQTPAELDRYKQFSMCINCLLCYSACPVYALEPHFVGPAAIALAARYNLDSRDQGSDQRRDIVAGPDGVWDCTLVGECSVVCPKGVDPAGAIQQAKLASALDWMKSIVLPWGRR